jgi:hypothetical protein
VTHIVEDLRGIQGGEAHTFKIVSGNGRLLAEFRYMAEVKRARS